MGRVEGEGFAAAGLAVAGFLNASDFVVNVMEDAASLVGALNQVAGFVVGVAAVDGAAGQRVLFAAGCLCAAPDGTLAFQTPHGVVVVQAVDAALCSLDFAVQFVAFDIADDFAVEADLVQVSAAVVEVIDMAAVGQDGADAVAQRVVSVAYGDALSVVDGGFADEAVEFVVGVGGNPACGIVDGNRQKEGVLRPSENRKNRWRALRHALLMNLEIYAGYGLLPES